MKKNENKALSSRGRAESSDVVISCDKVLINKKNPEKTKTVIPDLIGYLSRIHFILSFSDETSVSDRESQLNQKRISRDPRLIVSQFPRMTMLWILHFASAPFKMTFSTLALVTVLSVGIASKALAECVGATETTAGIDSVTKAHCGICGTNCNWKIEGDTLKVTGGANGEIGHMNDGATTINNKYTYVMPWKGLNNEFSKVDIQGVENVGSAAFRGFKNVTDIKLSDSITKIDQFAFAATNVKTVVLPDSLTSLGYRAFSAENQSPLEQIVISDSLNIISGDSHFGDDPVQLSNLKIICLGDTQKCQNLLSDYKYYDGKRQEGNRFVPFNLAGNVVAADYEYCNSTNYFWNGANCVREPDVTKRKCCASCKDMGGYCNRVRYTPAEAAEVLKDTDNEIIITFKVNR